jgi:hypothetical protein
MDTWLARLIDPCSANCPETCSTAATHQRYLTDSTRSGRLFVLVNTIRVDNLQREIVCEISLMEGGEDVIFFLGIGCVLGQSSQKI